MLTTIQRNVRQKMRAREMLAQVGDGAAALAILDPQYRELMDQMAFGNEGARQKGRAALPQMSTAQIRLTIDELERVLRPSGHLFLWVDKFTVVERNWRQWLRADTTLKPVDMIAWNKGRIGMGRRARCRTEYLIVLQKQPTRAKGRWTDHGIDDCWPEYSDSSVHPHAKPLALTIRLIKSTTKRGDLVVDPCAGGFGVLEACQSCGRDFLGCDIQG